MAPSQLGILLVAVTGAFAVSCVEDTPIVPLGDGGSDGGSDATPDGGFDAGLVIPPATDFAAAPLNTKVALTWTNPTFTGFGGVTLVRSQTGFPAAPTDGTVAFQGTATSFTDTGLTNGTSYFYSLFVVDALAHHSVAAQAQATPLPSGSLDPTFNAGKGYFVHPGLNKGDTWGTAVAVDAQGRIVVAGMTTGTSNQDTAVWRINSNGTIDSTFGTAGLFTHDNAGGGNGDDTGSGVAVDSQGRVIVTGKSASPSNGTRMVVWALTSAGALDTTFGASKGYVTRAGTDTTTGSALGNAVLLETGDKIVVGGETLDTTTGYDSTLWRLQTDGTSDTTFGAAGQMTDDMNLSNGASQITALAIGKDPKTSSNKLFAAGGSSSQAFARRYTLDGIIDLTFNTNGWTFANTINGGPDMGYAIAVDPSGNLFTAGTCTHNTPSYQPAVCVWELPSTGTAPGTEKAYNATASSYDMGNAAALTTQGLVVAGGTGINNNATMKVALWRLSTTDLSLDATFAQSGLMTTGGAAGGSDDMGYAIAVDTFGRFVVAGYSSNGSNYQMAVWRVIP